MAFEPTAQAHGIVGSVTDEPPWRAYEGQEPRRGGDVGEILPGVSRKATGRPTASVRAWIFVVRPPRERPMALRKAPLLRPPPSGAP